MASGHCGAGVAVGPLAVGVGLSRGSAVGVAVTGGDKVTVADGGADLLGVAVGVAVASGRVATGGIVCAHKGWTTVLRAVSKANVTSHRVV